jgi:hypothetical protein
MDAAGIGEWTTAIGSHAEPKDPSGETGDTVTEPKATLAARLGRLARAVRDGDDARVEDAVVSTPPYILGRIAILMFGSRLR